MKEESDLSPEMVEREKPRDLRELERKLEETKDELETLLDSYWDYAKHMLKFSFGSWIFSLSLFISIILLLYGPSLILNPPPLPISLLIGGGLAGVITISVGFLTKKRRRISKLKEEREKFESAYERNLLESKWKKAEERKEFLGTLLRHDLGNKIQIVQGYLKLLEDFDLPEEAEDFAEEARKGMNGGVELIKKAGTLREAEEEKTQEVNIGIILREVIDEYEERLSSNDMKLEHEIIDEKIKAGQLVKELLSNILENGIIHSEGSKIKIQVKEKNEEVVCTIEDDGEGIPDDKKDRIFDKGYTTDEERGTGLGMFLVKTLLEIYEGEIKVKDSELGGARFDVILQKA